MVGEIRSGMRLFIATSFHRRGTAAPTLSRLDQELQQCQHTTEAIDILKAHEAGIVRPFAYPFSESAG